MMKKIGNVIMRLGVAVVLSVSAATVSLAAPAPTVNQTEFSISQLTNTKWSFAYNTDPLVTSEMIIMPEMDGYTVMIDVQDNGYYSDYEMFQGYVSEIYSNENFGLILHCVSTAPIYEKGWCTNDVYVAWSGAEAIDFPVVVCNDEFAHLIEGNYAYSGMMAQ